MLLVQGQGFRNHCTGFVSVQGSSGETEELGTKIGSSYLVREPADRRKVGVTVAPTGFRTNATQFTVEQMSVLLQPCYVDHWATTSRGGGLSKARDFSLEKRHYRKQKRLDGLP